MFLIPKKNKNFLNKEELAYIINEFSFAEFSSALEMLYASKKCDNINLKKGFIKHSLDEYKHFKIFNQIKNDLINKKKYEYRFSPSNIYSKGYISKSHFLFDKKRLNEFSVFVAANEEIAEKKLQKLNFLVSKYSKHISKRIEEILIDEQKHHSLSAKFSKKNMNKFSYFIKFKKEVFLSNFRHLYANSLSKTQVIFYPILISLLVLMKLVSSFLNLDQNYKSKDILRSNDHKSII